MNVRAWLAGLSTRERNLVYLAAALLAAALLYLLLIMPLDGVHRRLESRVERKSADLAWMKQAAPQVAAAAAAGPAPSSTESLVVLVDRSARAAGLGSAVRDQSPSGARGLRLRLEGAPFDVVVAWLASLREQHGVEVESASVDSTPAPGLVNASITLTHAGSAG
ncbi:MAG TPA: type II secretion system protein M [Steroidobacteraceae bacterium]|nr:type II secretion system protein M [Steroidobacteraceae bacterium]